MFQRGDIVKSLDFPGMSEHYMIGEVVSVSMMDQSIRCKVLKTVVSGVTKKSKADFFVTPFVGNHFLDEQFPGRLTLIG